MKKYFFLFSLFFLLLSVPAFPQIIKNFSTDPVKFLDEMTNFLEETNKKEGEDIMNKFTEVWNSGIISTPHQNDIYRTANTMLRKHMKAFPDFKNYLNAIVSYVQSNQKAESFDAWQTSLDRLLLLPSKNFANYIIVCNYLFANNSLYESASTKWFTDNDSYQFDFDSLPKIIFPNMNLICVSKGDSSFIQNTKGVYYPTRQLYYGDGGAVSWERAGWDPKILLANLSHFVIDVTSSGYTADSVMFSNRLFFYDPLMGRLTDKIIANTSPENASYPRFESYSNSYEILGVVPDVDYRGGFSMFGNKMVGSGNRTDDAHIYIRRNNKPFFVAGSKAFIIRKEKITSDGASVTFYFDKDSLFHPSVTLKYIVKDRELSLVRGEEGKSQSPVFDSFHRVDMYFDGLYWKIDDPIIDMKMISGVGETKATFESFNYFRKNRFLKLQGLSTEHPMFTIREFAKKNNSQVVYTEEFAKKMRMASSEIRHLFIQLSNQGFTTYDAQDDKIILKEKLNYYLLANSGKIDYDIIEFNSLIREKANASINLLNFEMTIRGVASVALSDSQDVRIFPKDQEIFVEKNRDFIFAGRVKAGKFDFFGKQFKFDYDKFKINLDNVDSLRLMVESDTIVDVMGNHKLVPVKSVIEHIIGDLLIDQEGNKSGAKDFPQYPIFNSKKDSYVYYERPYIQRGVYRKDEFFFHLDPFLIDSMDNFDKSALRFAGNFVSAGILPDLRDSLKLQPDLSLGFTRETGEGGLPVYASKGKFTDHLSLSNEGLLGNGKIDYLTSTTESKEFIFLPDSMNTHALSFINRKEVYKGVEYPDVKGTEVYVHWMPKKDLMLVYSETIPINMYDAQAVIKGNLQLRPKGLTGEGLMTFAESQLEAKLFKYKLNIFDSDTSDFSLTAENTAALAFVTTNQKSHIDFTKRLGEFKSNSGVSYVRFPLNQYICYIDKFTWLMDNKEIEMSSSSSSGTSRDLTDAELAGLNIQGSKFISIEPRQDSLSWIAPYAKYSLKTYLIKADKVPFIRSADASIIPDSGHVVIERYAKMRTLNYARVIANNNTKFHTIYNATIDILGRKKYEGAGDYDFLDAGNVKHHLHFYKVTVDTTNQTFADGEITDAADFTLSPQFAYKGSVHMTASKKLLTFSGYAKPNFKCQAAGQNWIRFTNEINPANVQIPVDAPVTDNGVKLYTGIMQSNAIKGVYATFLTPKTSASDTVVIDATGVLTYNNLNSEFIITTKEKADKRVSAGNYVSMNDKTCMVYTEGKYGFMGQPGQMKMQTTGNMGYNIRSDSTEGTMMLALDFLFADEALKIMFDELLRSSIMPPTNANSMTDYERGLTELIGRDKAEKLVTDLNLYGAFKKTPDDLKHTLFLTDLKMRWDKRSRSFKSSAPFVVSIVNNNQLNKYVNGTVEFAHKRSGDVVTIYIQVEEGSWFYFTYTRGNMQTFSSYPAFNEAIERVKPDKRVSKEKDLLDYEYMLTTDRAVKTFIRNISIKTTVPINEEEPKPEDKQ